MHRHLGWVSLLAALLAGCGWNRNDGAPPFRVDLSVPDTVRVGEPVLFTLRVVNAGPRAAPVQLGGRLEALSFELVVRRRSGWEVWRRTRHEDFMDSAIHGDMEPGQAIENHYRWEQRNNRGEPLRPGTYWVSASLSINRQEVRAAPARLVISHR